MLNVQESYRKSTKTRKPKNQEVHPTSQLGWHSLSALTISKNILNKKKQEVKVHRKAYKRTEQGTETYINCAKWFEFAPSLLLLLRIAGSDTKMMEHYFPLLFPSLYWIKNQLPYRIEEIQILLSALPCTSLSRSYNGLTNSNRIFLPFPAQLKSIYTKGYRLTLIHTCTMWYILTSNSFSYYIQT